MYFLSAKYSDVYGSQNCLILSLAKIVRFKTILIYVDVTLSLIEAGK